MSCEKIEEEDLLNPAQFCKVSNSSPHYLLDTVIIENSQWQIVQQHQEAWVNCEIIRNDIVYKNLIVSMKVKTSQHPNGIWLPLPSGGYTFSIQYFKLYIQRPCGQTTDAVEISIEL
jgi:hypothetical protein